MKQKLLTAAIAFASHPPLVKLVLGLLGLSLVSFGCWLAWPPLGPIAAGVVMLLAVAGGQR